MKPHAALPPWLAQKLAAPPPAGAGIHAWLFSTARHLHAHLTADAIIAALQAATADCQRPVPLREIRDAVQNSLPHAWQPSSASERSRAPGTAPPRWPRPNPITRRCRLADSAAEGVGGLADLWERSPIRHDESPGPDYWLDILFPEAEWLCLAADHPSSARTRRRERWRDGPASSCGLVVPSPMTAPSGRGLDGRQSHRCLDNTGPRRWLVIEFDHGSVDEQAALHWHLGAAWPLALCVHSAGKSLHGWYGPSFSEERARELMEYAVSLGADHATWNRCQLVRLPGGRRAGRPLEVFYFNPDPCLSLNNSTAPGARAASTPPREPMEA